MEPARSPYEIFVRELVAMDGLDASEILLVDDRGTPTIGRIFSLPWGLVPSYAREPSTLQTYVLSTFRLSNWATVTAHWLPEHFSNVSRKDSLSKKHNIRYSHGNFMCHTDSVLNEKCRR